MTNKLLYVIQLLLGPLIFLFFWWLISHLLKQPNIFLSTPEETIEVLIKLIISPQVLIDVTTTFFRVLISFFVALFFGAPLGLLIGSNKKLLLSFEIIIDFFRSLPSTSLLPLFLLLFGINDLARIGIAAFVAFWTILFNTLYGVLHSSETRINVAKTIKATKIQVLRDVIFWESLPYLFAGMRLALSITLIIVIISEMVVSPKFGLGVRIYEMQQLYRIPQLYALIIFTGGIGYIVNKIFSLLEKRVVHWKYK